MAARGRYMQVDCIFCYERGHELSLDAESSEITMKRIAWPIPEPVRVPNAAFQRSVSSAKI